MPCRMAVSATTRRMAASTLGEIHRLLDAAAAAPRAAAEVMGELRDKLTDSMARDNAMLDERARVLDTLGALLERVNHASAEQRQAIDQLVGGSAEVLERTAARFAERLEADSTRLAEAAAHIGAGATEIASLGDAFGQAVQAFGESNTLLTGHLQQLDDTLAKSIARSDEQLAYYVAQAREVIDLSLSSQQQIMGDLQRLARERASELSAARGAAGAWPRATVRCGRPGHPAHHRPRQRARHPPPGTVAGRLGPAALGGWQNGPHGMRRPGARADGGSGWPAGLGAGGV